jgi:Uncharacterised protein family (UPF0104).
VLAVVIWRLGTGPFLAGLEAVDGRALLAAAAIFFVSTVCGAWRWTVVARGLGVRLSLPAAVAAYYRAVFLNIVLPGGSPATSIAVSVTAARCTTSAAA